MTYVITQNCCNDASCVPVCPVNCIHPTPDEPGYGTTEMLYIDPDGCIECGACLDACPVKAIEPDYDLPDESLPFLELNAAYYRDAEHRDYDSMPWKEPGSRPWQDPSGPLKVAVVGTGPAASYAVQHLMAQRGIEVRVDVFERLLTPYGLVRFGVAPDHLSTKSAADSFGRALRSRNVRTFLGVTVGEDVTHEQLAERYHAVIYGVGASRDRRLGIEGEDLPGSHAATDVVGWYNGHPDHAEARFDLGTDRAVIIGNGNVALDVARLLAIADPAELVSTDIAEHALEALRGSRLKEVRVVGRRGADVSAFTTPELLGLKQALGPRLLRSADLGGFGPPRTALDAFKRSLIEGLPTQAPPGDEPVLVLDYCRTPVAILGEDRVEAVRFARTAVDPATGATTVTDELEDVPAGLVIRSVGYRALPIKDLPFDEERAIVPHEHGRVIDPASGVPVGGVFVTGWVKRGPSGVIGTNRRCARETVESLLGDWEAGLLREPTNDSDVAGLLPAVTDLEAWKALDAHERSTGRAAGRPRVKVVDRAEQLAIIASAR